MRFDFSQIHRCVLLSMKRSGSTFLLDAVKELSHWCDDHSFSAYAQKGKPFSHWQSEFCLFRFHKFRTHSDNMDRYYPEVFFYPFIERVIEHAEKVIINQRFDIFDMALSDVVRQKRKGRSDDDLRNMRIDPVRFQNYFYQQLLFSNLWNGWLQRVVCPSKRYDISYSDIRYNIKETIFDMSSFIGMDLTYTGAVFHATDYTLLPNYDELAAVTTGQEFYFEN